jgi:NadR type nicotinamide-nucleotide adenylyltransferase
MEKGYTKMKTTPKIVVITGAESTGKSVLTKWLANHFQVPFIPEFAREYVENLNRHYNYSDVEFIAKKQISELNRLKTTNHPFIFADTWLIITKIWFEVVFNESPSWLDETIKNTPIELFLICDTNLPWIPDSVRENGGKQREILQKKYIDTIEHYGFDYRIIGGKNAQRFQNALEALTILKEN